MPIALYAHNRQAHEQTVTMMAQTGKATQQVWEKLYQPQAEFDRYEYLDNR